MFENQSVGKPANQEDGKLGIQPSNQMGNLPDVHPAPQQVLSTETQLVEKERPHPVKKEPIPSNAHREYQSAKSFTPYSIKQSNNQKIPTYKMTFNMREDIYKAFNDLYANLILQGRQTEKSELICEAIQLLLKKRERES